MSVIEVNHLTKDYGFGRGVFDVSINVEQGEVFGLLGPNGAGKSTTIRHLMGFSRPGSGEVKIFGEPTCWLDSVMQERFMDFIHEEKTRGKTILL